MTIKKYTPPGRLVLVEWLDSCSPGRKWHDRDIADNYGATTCFSVGYILRMDKQNVVICAGYNAGENGQYSDVTAIPRSVVKKITRLRT